MRVHVTAARLADVGRYHRDALPFASALGARLSLKETRAHPGRCGRAEKRRIGERVIFFRSKDGGIDSRRSPDESDTTERAHDPPRFASLKKTKIAWSRLRGKRGFMLDRKIGREDSSESGEDGSLGRASRRQTSARDRNVLGHGLVSPQRNGRTKSASSALKRRFRQAVHQGQFLVEAGVLRTAAPLTFLLPRERVKKRLGTRTVRKMRAMYNQSTSTQASTNV
jgi:hypothetical protein